MGCATSKSRERHHVASSRRSATSGEPQSASPLSSRSRGATPVLSSNNDVGGTSTPTNRASPSSPRTPASPVGRRFVSLLDTDAELRAVTSNSSPAAGRQQWQMSPRPLRLTTYDDDGGVGSDATVAPGGGVRRISICGSPRTPSNTNIETGPFGDTSSWCGAEESANTATGSYGVSASAADASERRCSTPLLFSGGPPPQPPHGAPPPHRYSGPTASVVMAPPPILRRRSVSPLPPQQPQSDVDGSTPLGGGGGIVTTINLPGVPDDASTATDSNPATPRSARSFSPRLVRGATQSNSSFGSCRSPKSVSFLMPFDANASQPARGMPMERPSGLGPGDAFDLFTSLGDLSDTTLQTGGGGGMVFGAGDGSGGGGSVAGGNQPTAWPIARPPQLPAPPAPQAPPALFRPANSF